MGLVGAYQCSVNLLLYLRGKRTVDLFRMLVPVELSACIYCDIYKDRFHVHCCENLEAGITAYN